jgi:plasmid stabilization system protein ParE
MKCNIFTCPQKERRNPGKSVIQKEFLSKCEAIAGELQPRTRELVVHENYVVPYRVKGDIVQIIRVQHVARLWPKQFLG